MERVVLKLPFYLWALPNTMLGCALGLVCLFSGGRVGICRGVIEFSGGRCKQWMTRKSARVLAITLGHSIVAVGNDELCLVREHEHVHVKQYERWGPLFLPAYALSSLWQLLRGRHIYFDNAFEREAFAVDTSPQPTATKRERALTVRGV